MTPEYIQFGICDLCFFCLQASLFVWFWLLWVFLEAPEALHHAARGLFLVAAHSLSKRGLSSCSVPTRLPRSMWILIPQPGTQPMFLGFGWQILNHWTTREVTFAVLITWESHSPLKKFASACRKQSFWKGKTNPGFPQEISPFLLLVYSTIIYSLHATVNAQTEDKTVNKKDLVSPCWVLFSDAEADFLIKGHINNYLITILLEQSSEGKLYCKWGQKSEGPVVVWPRA